MEKIGQTKTLDSLARPLEELSGPLFKQGNLNNAFTGKQLGHPLHPLLVSLPIGLFTSASLLDFIPGNGHKKMARRFIALGLMSAVPTALSGLADWRYTSGPERRIGLVHALVNTSALSCYAASWIVRQRGGSGKLLALKGATVLTMGGYLGGHMVYAMGVGIDTNAFSGGPRDWTPIVKESDVKADSFYVGEAMGERVLLTRQNGEIVAIANRCSHRGGPLNEGERKGDCVVCPWHGSMFSLLDGSVVEGPAVRAQQRFDVQIRDGNVEVRHNAEVTDLVSYVDAPKGTET